MIKKVIDISQKAYIRLKHRQLIIEIDGETVSQSPVEDIGVLILQNPGIVITQACLIACQQNNVAVLFCDSKRLPYSLLLPISDGHTLHSKILRQQIAITEPTKKRLWQQIVIYKIKQQIQTLKAHKKEAMPLEHMLVKVKSGDPQNMEAQAAQRYWRILLGEDFRRDYNGDGINALLNYGYAIIRALIARAIVCGGLHPSIGLHHQNQYNDLCLADDLMEPFRPCVDSLVYQLVQNNPDPEINTETKQVLLGLLSENVLWEGRTTPLMVACHYLIADVKKAFLDSKYKLYYPQLPPQIAA